MATPSAPYLGMVSIIDEPPAGVPAPFLGVVLRSDVEKRLEDLESGIATLEAEVASLEVQTGGNSGFVDAGTF